MYNYTELGRQTLVSCEGSCDDLGEALDVGLDMCCHRRSDEISALIAERNEHRYGNPENIPF